MSNEKQKVIEKLKNDPLMPLRHSAEHVLHTAMKELYPDIKLVMGPPIENGFYFDFDLDQSISPEDFGKIEKKMHEIIDANLRMTMRDSTKKEILDLFKGNEYKENTVNDIINRGENITVCIMGEENNPRDIDLCAGPHTNSTGDIKAFKLLSVAGAYYKGDENNKMLQRIYGTAFDSKQKLDEYLHNLEEAKKRDHRILGKELDLFTFVDEVGPGLTLWKPKGQIICDELTRWAEETEKKWGYQRVRSPHIAKGTLYEISGHLPYYKDDMYSPMEIDGEDYYLKGMNCPHHHMIYKSTPKSYRDLPLRYAEYGEVYRYEQSGTLFGLMRVRFIQQNDAHIYCSIDHAEEEFLSVLRLHEYYYQTLGLSQDDYYIVIGLPDEDKRDKYHGDKDMWDKAEKMMRNAISKTDIKTVDDIGGAAFYGPKIDFNIKSSIGREFSISTNQLDLFMPKRFELEFINKNGEKEECAVIHRAPLGSHERFVGFLIEHFGGAFPVWLSPVQVQIIPVSDKNLDYCEKIKSQLLEDDIRVEVDNRDASMGNKIREAQMQKVPYMIIVGDKEQESGKISVRLRSGEQQNDLKLEEFISKVKEMYLTKSLKLW